MKKTALIAGLAMVALLGLSSCSAMFDSNVFQNAKLGQPDVAKLDTTSSTAIADMAQTESFFTDLAAAPDTKAAVLATLGVTSTTTTADVTTALAADPATASDFALAATIEIKTTDAGVVVDNLMSQIPTFMAGTGGSPDMATIMNAVMPASVLAEVGVSATPPQAFVDMVSSFTSAAEIFTALAAANTLPAASDYTTQDLAFFALASVAVDAVTPAAGFTPSTTGLSSDQIKAEALWAAMSDPTATTSPITIDPTKLDTSTLGTVGDTSTLGNLLALAGIDLSKFTSSGTTTTTP